MTRTPALLLIVPLTLLQGARTFAQQAEAHTASTASARQFLSAHAFPDLPQGEPVKCALGMLAYAVREPASLPPGLQAAVSRILQRDVLQKSRTSGHFTVHYDTVGSQAAAMLDSAYQAIPGSANEYADSVLAIANRVYAIEIIELGYATPPTDGTLGGGPEHDIYVQDLPNEYGETFPEVALDAKMYAGGQWITFVRIDNDFSFVRPNANKGMPALRVTLAHEFHHVIQLGSYAYWSEDLYFHELTSTWMEDAVFPGVNDYLNYVRSARGHFRNPQLSFTASDGLIEYSRAIWGHFVADKFGRDLMRTSWENVKASRPLDAIDQTIRAVTASQSNLRIEFSDWVLWNYYTGSRADSTRYYPKGALYPEIAQIPSEFVPPTGMITGEIQALSAHYRQVYTPGDTVVLIQLNMNSVTADLHSSDFFPYSIYLSSSQIDESYEPVGNYLFFKTSVSDPSNWKTWKIVQGVASSTELQTGVAFPNPFRPPDPRSDAVYIAAQASRGTLYIYNSSMNLVFQASQSANVSRFGKPVFWWSGNTSNNSPVQTGIYIFVLALPDRTLTGKIALIRK